MAAIWANLKSIILPLVLGIIAAVEFILNVLQFFSNRSKERRLKKYEQFEHEAHLQILNPKVVVTTEIGHSFWYSGSIENCGSKTVQIENVLLEVGSKDKVDKCYKHVVERGFYLKAGDHKEIHEHICSEEIEESKSKFGLEDCFFSLRIIFLDASGATKEQVLPLASIGSSGIIFASRRGIIT